MKLLKVLAKMAEDVRTVSSERSDSWPLLVVAEDGLTLHDAVAPLCAALGIEVRSAPSELALRRLLASWEAIAVLTAVEGVAQDGCNVMLRVAEYERSLPLLLLTGRDPALVGAAEAVRDLWHLTAVEMYPELPGPGALAEFLCNAVRLGDNRTHGPGN
jgi:hypothetical protein